MAKVIKRRKDIEKHVLTAMKLHDPSGFNEKRWKERFASMSESEFYDWMVRIKEGKSQVYIEAPNLKVTMTMDDIIKASEYVGSVFFDHLRMYDSTTGRWYKTPKKFMVLKLPVRRLKQYLEGKISIPESDKTINPTTGQVVKPDKGSAISMTQAQTIDSKGLQKTLVELFNIRGGNIEAYANYKAALEENGTASLAGLTTTGKVRSAVVAKVILESMLIDNNLV